MPALPPDRVRTHAAIDPQLCGEVVELETGRAITRLRPSERMRVDESGLVHGGFVFGLADHAAMLAVNEPTVVLAAAKVRFLKPVVYGTELHAQAKVTHRDGRRVTVEVTVGHDDVEVFSGEFSCFVPEQHVLAP